MPYLYNLLILLEIKEILFLHLPDHAYIMSVGVDPSPVNRWNGPSLQMVYSTEGEYWNISVSFHRGWLLF